MAEDKKYYWLKLKRDFFKRHDIRIIETMPNGKDYVLFYLKLLLESIDHEGSLRFSETIPYNEDMLSVITNTNIDIVRSAMKLFMELKMVEIFDDSTIFMNEVQKLIGSETKWAEKKRKFRKKEDNVPALSPPCPLDVRQEIELEKETEIENRERERNKYDDGDVRVRDDIIDFFSQYFCIEPTGYEIDAVYNSLTSLYHGQDEPFKYEEDEKELLEIAFKAAADSGNRNVAYIDGVFKQMWRRKIRTADDYWVYAANRDIAMKRA